MPLTTSGDYQLPVRFLQGIGNIVLWLIRWIPKPIEEWILKRHRYYQVFRDDGKATPGSSRAKWNALHMPADLTGKSVIDIGCAEGFFCLEAAGNGADIVVGVDSRLTTLVSAQLLASKHKADVSYQMAVFPNFKIRMKFDYVLCLSVLHHLVSTKEIWKIMSDKNYIDDWQKLEQYLRFLCSMTKMGGSCIVEMPYEYDKHREMKNIDFELFTQCFLRAGFSSAEVLGQWEHTERQNKDRIVYVGIR